MLRVLAPLRPSFFAQKLGGGRPGEVSFCPALLHLVLLSALLSIPTTIVCVARLLPALASFSAGAALQQAEVLFPRGIELIFNGSSAQIRPIAPAADGAPARDAAEEEAGADDDEFVCWETDGASWCAASAGEGELTPILLRLPPLLYDLFYSDLPPPFGAPPARVCAPLLGEDEDRLLDPYPFVNEFAAGQEAEARRGLRSLLWGAGWERTSVLDARPHQDVRRYLYRLRFAEDARRGAEGRGRSALDVRRTPAIALVASEALESAGLVAPAARGDGGEERAAVRRRMLGLRASVAISPGEVHVLQGFTPHFGQYWQYEHAPVLPLRTTKVEVESGSLFGAAAAHRPVGLALSMLCEEQVGSGDPKGGGGAEAAAVVCSRDTAAAATDAFRSSYPRLVALLDGAPGLLVPLAAATVGLVGIGRQLLYTLPTFAAVHVPAVYLTVNLLRHVDTAPTPVRVAATLAAYGATPLLLLDEAASLSASLLGSLRPLLADGALLCGALGGAGHVHDTSMTCPTGGWLCDPLDESRGEALPSPTPDPNPLDESRGEAVTEALPSEALPSAPPPEGSAAGSEAAGSAPADPGDGEEAAEGAADGGAEGGAQAGGGAREVVLTKPEAHVPFGLSLRSDPPARFGSSPDEAASATSHGALQVEYVEPGSLAAAAGLRAGSLCMASRGLRGPSRSLELRDARL